MWTRLTRYWTSCDWHATCIIQVVICLLGKACSFFTSLRKHGWIYCMKNTHKLQNSSPESGSMLLSNTGNCKLRFCVAESFFVCLLLWMYWCASNEAQEQELYRRLPVCLIMCITFLQQSDSPVIADKPHTKTHIQWSVRLGGSCDQCTYISTPTRGFLQHSSIYWIW